MFWIILGSIYIGIGVTFTEPITLVCGIGILAIELSK